MHKKTSLMLKRAFFLLVILAAIAYLFVPNIVVNFMDDVSVTVTEEFYSPPELNREVEVIELIGDEDLQTTKAEEQETIYINEKEATQTADSSLEETPGKEPEQKELSHQENSDREEARHKRMQPSIDKFIENIKSTDWYK